MIYEHSLSFLSISICHKSNYGLQNVGWAPLAILGFLTGVEGGGCPWEPL